MALLEVCNLSAGIKRGREYHALTKKINFSVNAGETVALIGESGCGKTLTALSIMQLLPPAVEVISGKILLEAGRTVSTDLCSADEKTLCRIRGKEISMVFQEPRQSLNPLMRVGTQIAETLMLRGTDKKEAAQAALDMLRKLRFDDPQRIYCAWPHQLSGGMCQRVMIAMAAIARPALLIADEPASSLDTQNQERCIALLKQINAEFGSAVLFITHDLSLAKRMCSRFMVMHEGTIVDSGHPFAKAILGFTANEKKKAPPSVMRKTILSIRNVSNTYSSRSLGAFGIKEVKPVLHNINLDIGAGEIFGICGESGAGKSTLARCILGLIDYKGEIITNTGVQAVFQDPGMSLNPVKKIGWLMEEPLHIHRIGTSQQRSRKADQMLERVGLDPSFRSRRVRELSGGQKQRVCIGRALMLAPSILIADEIVSALDVFACAQILNLLRDLRDSLGLTIIFISHNIGAVESLCDRSALMKSGKLYMEADSIKEKTE